MVASYSELYEGEVDHINGPTHPPRVGYRQIAQGEELFKRSMKGMRSGVFMRKNCHAQGCGTNYLMQLSGKIAV